MLWALEGHSKGTHRLPSGVLEGILRGVLRGTRMGTQWALRGLLRLWGTLDYTHACTRAAELSAALKETPSSSA